MAWLMVRRRMEFDAACVAAYNAPVFACASSPTPRVAEPAPLIPPYGRPVRNEDHKK
ncbi:hypothetical protein [Xylella fastidiosa]|uniref:hypothetical protein n=1 Tax=Xylella fastidiosa TaxID=2371 RepID=UPI003984FEB0